jgi:membrane-associated phospholipid phosphatase
MPDASLPSIAARFRILLREKLLLTIALNVFFWTGYSLLARNALFPVREVPLTPLDRAIPFDPQLWTPLYLSEYIITFFIPWLITKRTELRNFVRAMLIMSCACFAIFLFFPTASPRPQIIPELPLYHFVLWMDGPLNAFPSLHAAFLIFTLCLAREILKPLRAYTWISLWLWAAAILYATIATRQHYVADLLAGALIGYVSHKFAWRTRKAPAEASASTVLSCASQSHDGAR